MTTGLVPPEVRKLSEEDARGLAVFDADGVLWEGDVSEDFTLWMIGEGHFDGQLWPIYERCNAEDPEAGCFQILNFYAGMTLTEIRTHVARFWQCTPERPWLVRVRATVQWMHKLGFSVYIVSGTPDLVLEPLKRHLSVDGVFGLGLEIDDDGRATGQSAGIATVGVGKAERIRAASRDPVRLAVGNSVLDIPMLKLSTGIAWAVNPDVDLRGVAETSGWLVTAEGN